MKENQLQRLKPPVTYSQSNFDRMIQPKNIDEKAYERFKKPCFFQSGGTNDKNSVE